MQKNLYYHTVLRRRNVWKDNFLAFVEGLASYPRLSLEVFIRKNFGHRYFKLSSAITVAFVLILFPIIADKIGNFITLAIQNRYYGSGVESEGPSFWAKYATWYIFVIAFLVFSIRRHRESRLPTAWFDASKFSLYSGDIDERFYTMPPFKVEATIRQVMIVREPLFFFAIGVVLWIMGQSLGWLLVINSLFYSFSYASAYRKGDDLIWDIIDQIIMNRSRQETFVDDLSGRNTQVRYYLTKPGSRELRELVADAMVIDPNEIAVAL